MDIAKTRVTASVTLVLQIGGIDQIEDSKTTEVIQKMQKKLYVRINDEPPFNLTKSAECYFHKEKFSLSKPDFEV